MKKLILFTIICSLALFTACGENVKSDSPSETIKVESKEAETDDDSSYVEEVAEEEIETDDPNYSSEEDNNEDVIESKDEKVEVKRADSPYVPMDDYWISDKEIDLSGWLEANNCYLIYYDHEPGEYMSIEKSEESPNTIGYEANFLFTQDGDKLAVSWRVGISKDVVSFDFYDYQTNQDFSSDYMDLENVEMGNEHRDIIVNPYGMKYCKRLLTVLEDTVRAFKNDPNISEEQLAATNKDLWVGKKDR